MRLRNCAGSSEPSMHKFMEFGYLSHMRFLYYKYVFIALQWGLRVSFLA